jgi:hypothetical protein
MLYHAVTSAASVIRYRKHSVNYGLRFADRRLANQLYVLASFQTR